MQLDYQAQALVGHAGSLSVRGDDEITRKLAMLIEGECEGLGPLKAAEKFGFSKQRYFQLRKAFGQHGAQALRSQPRGPKTNYRNRLFSRADRELDFSCLLISCSFWA